MNLSRYRYERGLSQADVARILGRSQGWVAKLENRRPQDRRIGDLEAFFNAIGIELVISLENLEKGQKSS